MDTLDDFTKWSGLRINVAKSQIAVHQEKSNSGHLAGRISLPVPLRLNLQTIRGRQGIQTYHHQLFME